MYDNLKSIGIINPTSIDEYSLRQEVNFDILKIYFKKEKGDFFAKSVKFKYPRQHKTIMVDSGTHQFKQITEISPDLRYVIEELDSITQHHQKDGDVKAKILADLHHLEKVVTRKIAEIEADLERL
jgi:hypothetical protein